MSGNDFRSAFEEYVPVGLQAAFDYVDAHEAVETIWIAAHRDGDWSLSAVAYRIRGQIVDFFDVVKIVPTLDNSRDKQFVLRAAADGATDLLLMGRPDGPTRFVIRYDVAAEEMNADFYYEPLFMEEHDTLSEVHDRWLRRLQATGNDSASD